MWEMIYEINENDKLYEINETPALSAGSLAAFAPPPDVVRLLIAADRDATGRRAAATLEARALAQGIAATVLTPEGGDFNDDLAALGPQALAVRLGHGMM